MEPRARRHAQGQNLHKACTMALPGKRERGAAVGMPDEGTFGIRLRDYRLAANLTQEELAERAGLSVEAVGALERGDRRSPRPSTIESLSRALKLDARQRDAFIAAGQGKPAPEAPLDRVSETPIAPDAGARLAEAEALLTSLPTNNLLPRASLPPGSRMPLA